MEHVMKKSCSVGYALGALMTAAALSGCSAGSQSALIPSGPMQQTAARAGFNFQPAGHRLNTLAAAAGPVAAVRAGRRGIAPQVLPVGKSLWISDAANNDVQIYNYPIPSPSASPVATLLGITPSVPFVQPQGECVDNAGHVFVTSTANSYIYEFNHNGTPVQMIDDPGQYPVGCAWDRTTGNLAVSNILTTSGGPGSISLYTPPYGAPTIITNAAFGNVYFLGYRPNGVLFADGFNSSAVFALWKLVPPTGSGVATISTAAGCLVGGGAPCLTFPGGVQWDGAHMTVGDQNAGTINRFLGTGAWVGPIITLSGAGTCDVVQYFIGSQWDPIAPARVVGPEAGCGVAQVFTYPAGALQALGNGLSQPVGSAVSP
jgi:hypothetical protein